MTTGRQPNEGQNSESVAFRMPASLKAELSELAARNQQSLGELLRGVAREWLALERHRIFKAQAKRQSRQAAGVALDPGTDEFAVMRELQAELDEINSGWN